MRILPLILGLLLLVGTATATPFPIKGPIWNAEDQLIGYAHVYPRYVEVFDTAGNNMGRAGILVNRGLAKIYLVESDKFTEMAGHAVKGVVYDRNNKVVGHYVWTSTYSFIHDTQGRRAGKVKCIAWPRICAVGVAGILLNLLQPDERTP